MSTKPSIPPFEQPLDTTLRGRVVRPSDSDYDEARALYNAMIDKCPRLIARCEDAADVIAAVNHARHEGLLTAIRGGGHNGPGLGSCDDGLLIDLSRMRGVRVDPESRTARVEGGCRWRDVDHATHAFGLAVPSGMISTTGVGGLTLGGGHGYLSRKYGLTIDNLLSVDVVLADGRLVTASDRENEDLFWALRGGGGNFGVVTSFEFQLHPVDNVFAGPMLWPMEAAPDVMRWYDGLIAKAPDDVYGFFAFLTVPPAPPFPEALHGKKMCGVIWCFLGAKSIAHETLERAHEPAEPAFQHIGEVPYPALQATFDGLYPPGYEWYWSGDFQYELSDEAIAQHMEHAAELPTPLSTMHLYPINGAVHRVGANTTAFSHRDVRYSQVVVGVAAGSAMRDTITRWTKDYASALRPYGAGGAYVNFMMDEGNKRVRATYRDNYPRLVEVKRRYDPHNFFRVNQNIDPEAYTLD